MGGGRHTVGRCRTVRDFPPGSRAGRYIPERLKANWVKPSSLNGVMLEVFEFADASSITERRRQGRCRRTPQRLNFGTIFDLALHVGRTRRR